MGSQYPNPCVIWVTCVCVCNLIGIYPSYTTKGRRKKYKLRDLVYGSVISVYGCHNMWEFMIMEYDTQSHSRWHWNTQRRKTLQWAEFETGYLVIHFVWKRSDPWEEYILDPWTVANAWLISQEPVKGKIGRLRSNRAREEACGWLWGKGLKVWNFLPCILKFTRKHPHGNSNK